MATLRQAITEMAAMQREMAETSNVALDDPGAKPRLLAMRRRYAEHMIAMAEAIEHDPGLRDDPRLAQEFRTRFSQMRTAIAFHQAKWPVVLIGEGGEAFRQSARKVTETNDAFVAWAAGVLK